MMEIISIFVCASQIESEQQSTERKNWSESEGEKRRETGQETEKRLELA